jgi:hypothetical protein
MKFILNRKFWLCLLLASTGFVALSLYAKFEFSEETDAEASFARFTPSEVSALNALGAALRSWQKGNPPGKVEGLDSPDVILVDTCRRPEQTLERFVILGEAAGEGPRCFAVRVCLSNPNEEQRLRFVVFGVDPLWVYRYEDYEMLVRWECGREERASKAASLKKDGE